MCTMPRDDSTAPTHTTLQPPPQNIVEGQFSFPSIMQTVEKERARLFITDLLQTFPENRLGLKRRKGKIHWGDILSHPLFDDLDKNAIARQTLPAPPDIVTSPSNLSRISQPLPPEEDPTKTQFTGDNSVFEWLNDE
mmetsp:Transcript_57973/g.136642  ORF Transcript_57973/g.136642 Transcript_57973/m.136642 type:complete len:137 (-) Transcript_57973:22-432(-)